MEATNRKRPHRCFRNIITGLLLPALILMVVSCSGSKTIQKTPKFRYTGTTLSKSVSDSGYLGIPATATNQFSTKDKAVFAHLSFGSGMARKESSTTRRAIHASRRAREIIPNNAPPGTICPYRVIRLRKCRVNGSSRSISIMIYSRPRSFPLLGKRL